MPAATLAPVALQVPGAADYHLFSHRGQSNFFLPRCEQLGSHGLCRSYEPGVGWQCTSCMNQLPRSFFSPPLERQVHQMHKQLLVLLSQALPLAQTVLLSTSTSRMSSNVWDVLIGSCLETSRDVCRTYVRHFQDIQRRLHLGRLWDISRSPYEWRARQPASKLTSGLCSGAVLAPRKLDEGRKGRWVQRTRGQRQCMRLFKGRSRRARSVPPPQRRAGCRR